MYIISLFKNIIDYLPLVPAFVYLTDQSEEDEWYGIVYECPRCENPNMVNSRYCSHCGKRIIEIYKNETN